MLSIWMKFKQNGKGFYLPDQQNWLGQIVLAQEETGWMERVVFSVRSLDDTWYLQLPEGFKWHDGLAQPERVIQSGQRYGINGKFGDIAMVAGTYQRENTIYRKYFFPNNGRLSIGRDAANDLCFQDPLASARHGFLVGNGQNAAVYTDTSENGTYINGALLRGANRQLRFGDRIDIPDGLSLIWLGSVLAINQPTAMKPVERLKPYTEPPRAAAPPAPADAGQSVYVQYHRSPRRLQKANDAELEVEGPLPMQARNDMPAYLQLGPSLTMVLPMATMALFMNRGAASLVMVGTSAVVAIFWSIMNRRHNEKKWQQDEDLRLSVCRQYYAETEEKLIIERNRERERLLHNYLSSQECVNLPRSSTHRLWERMPSHRDFLELRLGLGELPLPLQLSVPKEKLSLVEDPLRYEPRRLRDSYSVLRDVPITVDVIKHRLIGILGSERTPWVMQNMVVQAAANHSYHDVRIAVLYTPDTRNAWHWTKWLPHVFATDDRELRMAVSEPAMVQEVLSRLDAILSIRADANSERSGDTGFVQEEEEIESGAPYRGELPYYMVFVADPHLIEDHPITRYMASDDLGFSMVVQAATKEMLPKECKLIIESKAQLGAVYTDQGDVTGTQFDLIAPQQLENFAKQLAPVRVQDSQGNAAIPSYLTFLDVYKARNTSEIDIWRFWNENKTYERIDSYLGVRAGSQPFALNIKFGANGHGPHGLLAGTTGSGKSVLLQSLILSLAVNYGPRDVQFVLIDYKGGGTSEVFRELPHVVGIIDNLQGERAIYRALASIDGEIKRRQAMFKAVEGGSIADIDDYIKLAEMDDNMEKLSHLVVVIDEFAELKADQPDFMASMVKAARVGRSAGLHLLLATQTPSGSVSDEIKANTNFRICLRVADSSESRYMLNRPDAAYLRGMGRAYVQVGNDEIFELIQTSYSGAVYDPSALTAEEEPKVLNEAGMPIVLKRKRAPGEKKARAENQLDAVLKRINEVMALHNVPVPGKLWHDQLPFAILLETLPSLRSHMYAEGRWPDLDDSGDLRAPYALADNIAQQKYDEVVMDFTNDKNHMVIGLSGSGKTTILQTLALSLALRYDPGQVQIYAFSLTGGMLRSLEALPHVGDVVYEEQPDDQIRLIDLLYQEDARRKALLTKASTGSFEEYNRLSEKRPDAYTPLPAIVVLVDRMQQVRDWEEMKRKDGLDKFFELLQTASSRGIYFVITALASSELPLKYHAFVKRIALQLNDRSDYMDALNVRIPADEWTGVEVSEGRGMVATENGVMEMQTTIFGTDQSDVERTEMIEAIGLDMQSHWRGIRPLRVPRIPEEPHLSDLLALPEVEEALQAGGMLPLGYDKQTAMPVMTSFLDNNSFLIVGAAKSGKTTLLKTIGATLAEDARARVYLIGDADLCQWAGQNGAQGYNPMDAALPDVLTALKEELAQRVEALQAAAAQGAQAVQDVRQGHAPLYIGLDDVDGIIAQGDKAVLDALTDLAGDKARNTGICLFAAISHSRYKENSAKQPLNTLVRQKRGFMLQGKLNECDPFMANVPYSMKNLAFPTGEALYLQEGIVTHLVLPMLD
ncbi:MAG: type VII secretion protein EssC [Christensenellales bacterium]|jgi:S-DNA-T family DNA segregation ATPase FtsK/SpoIIIE